MALRMYLSMCTLTTRSWIRTFSFLVILCLAATSDGSDQKTTTSDPGIPKIDLLLSGGGFRASAFSFGVMAGLNEICLSTQTGDFTPRKKDPEGKLQTCKKGKPLLEQVNLISAVSGGAITAAYFQTHHEDFFEKFPAILKETNLEWKLLKAEKTPTLKRTLRSPVFLLTSIWDTIGSILGLPLSLLNLNIELTPVAVMSLSDGLLESEQLARVYKDLFYQDTRLGDELPADGFPIASIFGKERDAAPSKLPTILLNSSDIANGTVFTFDHRTFKCMGLSLESANVEVALAVAASSSLPGVFSPVRLDNLLSKADPTSIPSDCSLSLANPTRRPLLVDGGVTDNLGAVGLLRNVIRAKEKFFEPEEGKIGASSSPITHLEDPSQKHLLLFVNAEAEAESHLPGLAGHFDSSYDVLIRSKKDLVRVMASDMFNHFGFGSLELKLSDIVSSEPGITNILASESERINRGAAEEADLEQAIPQILTATQQEQRVKRTLDEVGMLPAANEIDALITVGRKIVFNHLSKLQATFKALSKKKFDPNCFSISNPDRFFCWPDQFRSHDLDSGGGSAFLVTVTEVMKRFIQTTTHERAQLISHVKQQSLDYLINESTSVSIGKLHNELWTKLVRELSSDPAFNCENDAFWASIKNTEWDQMKLTNILSTLQTAASILPRSAGCIKVSEEIAGLVKETRTSDRNHKTLLLSALDQFPTYYFPNDAKLEQLYERFELRPRLHNDCLNAISKLQRWLKDEISEWWKEDVSLDTVLESLEKGLTAHRAANCSPNYYILASYLTDTSRPDQDLVSMLISAVKNYSTNFNAVNLHGFLGTTLIYSHRDFQEGLKEIKKAIRMAKQHIADLKQILDRLAFTSEDQEFVRAQIDRMEFAQKYHETLYVQFISLSPLPSPAHEGEISDTALRSWERKYMSFREGKSLLEEIDRRDIDDELKSRLSGTIASLEHILLDLAQAGKHKEGIISNIRKLIGSKQSTSISSTPEIHHGPHNHNKAITIIRGHIRSYLALTAGMEEAEELTKQLYSASADEERLSALRSDILGNYGLILILKNLDSPCPARNHSVIQAANFIEEANKGLSPDKQITDGDHERGIMEGEVKRIEWASQRLKYYRNLAESQGCT